MPTLFILFGLWFYFFSREHNFIHVHVEKGDGVAKFVVEPNVRLIENHGLKPNDLKLAESIIEENREVIIEHWIEFFGK